MRLPGFANTANMRHRTGLLSIEGSASGTAERDVASSDPGATTRDAGAESAVTLTVASGCTYAFNAAFSSVAFDVNKTGDTVLTFDFVGGESGSLTLAWDEA